MKYDISLKPTHMELTMVAKPKEGMTNDQLIKILDKLDNPMLSESKDGITLVRQTEKLWSEEAPEVNEMVWLCDYCKNAYSKNRDVILSHEVVCQEKNNLDKEK